MNTISLDQGVLRGTEATNYNGDKYYKFLGIPYAKPPIGPLRFKAPQPLENWAGTLDATQERSACYSRHPFIKNKIIGSEDCLFLNVFTKNLNATSPVLFWIHGGGFINGSSSTEVYGPEFLTTEDIVLVTLNYRLGIFGFLALDDPTLETPGNAGFKDIVMALKWVRTNISNFGGDPKNVTVFGQSAGAVAVHLLMLSKMGRGLFHKAIAQSGCALNPWARGTTGVQEIVSVLNLQNSDERSVYDHLMTLSSEELHQIQEEITTNTAASKNRAFAFVVEGGSGEAFLEEEPLDIINSGGVANVPFIIGYNNAETIVLDLFRKRNWPGADSNEDCIPWNWGYKLGSPESLAVRDQIRNFYFGERSFEDLHKHERIPMYTDVNFVFAIHLTVLCQHQRSKAPIYVYRMSVETELNLLRKIFNVQIPGVVHGDDVGYLFKNFATPEISPGSQEDVSIRRFVKLWTNFARCGNPTPFRDDPLLNNVKWRPVMNHKLEFLNIGKKLGMMNDQEEAKRIRFLLGLYEKSPNGQKYSAHL